MAYRIEKDTMGPVEVPADKLWGGAQTQRSRDNFKIGAAGSMPLEIVYGFAYLKKAAAYTNSELGVLQKKKGILSHRFVMKFLLESMMTNFLL
ncbi:fumarate hydratase class II [Nonlabens ulvanivorans]|uniref:Fumarate hydratase class II n=1 Tax=Nonlabens ulvanivorans TaxID=906888 RepID=A0A090QJM1_NONUL|nr:fumarate hydratase class II [Nonlabens ulvanivorans]